MRLLLCCMHVSVQVLHTLNVAEGYRAGEQRNILQVWTASAVLARPSKPAAGFSTFLVEQQQEQWCWLYIMLASAVSRASELQNMLRASPCFGLQAGGHSSHYQQSTSRAALTSRTWMCAGCCTCMLPIGLKINHWQGRQTAALTAQVSGSGLHAGMAAASRALNADHCQHKIRTAALTMCLRCML